MKTINPRQKLFCDLYKDSTNLDYFGNATKCYQLIYKVKDENNAAVNASNLLRNPKIIDYMENKNKSTIELLAENSNKLLKKALELADQGNTTILSKLLDKIAPTLQENHNTNAVETVDDYLNNLIKKYDNKAEQEPKHETPTSTNKLTNDETISYKD